MRLRLGLICALCAGCGEQTIDATIGMNVRVSGLSQNEVSYLEGFVFEPRLVGGEVLTRIGLLDGTVDPRGSQVVPLAASVVNVNVGQDVTMTFSNVESGENRLVFIESFDGHNPAQQNGRGAIEGVTVEDGESRRIQIWVEAL